MTLLRSLLGFLAITSILFSCKKERSDEDGKVPGIIETSWEFKENGELFNGDMDSAYIQTSAGFSALTMTGSWPDSSGELILQIIGSDITKGTFSNGQIFFQYSEGGTILYQTIPGQTGDFSITITEIDSAHVTGTFTGTAYDASGGSHSIQEGKFTVEMTGSAGPDPSQDGLLTVWSKEMCFDGSSIEVKVNGQTAFITEAMVDEPTCNANGAASFSLPMGVYAITAICGGDTLTYNVTVNSSCVKQMVDFTHPPELEDYLPLTHGSYWDYRDLNNEFLTQRTTAQSDTVIDGRLYTMHVSMLPDTFYYRKDPNIYYQYITLDYGGFVNPAPSLEIVILKDNVPVNSTWETPPIDLNLSGVFVKAKLLCTVAQKDFSAIIADVTYNDLIQVNTKILFSSDGGATYFESGSEYSQVFAKGKGVVYYYDIDRDIEWGAYGTSIVP